MMENFLYPFLVATLTAVAVGVLRERGREASERRIDFYCSDEARQKAVRLSEFQGTQRIRAQARLIALDHVRRTAAVPFGFFVVMAAGTLFVGWRELFRDIPEQGDAAMWIALGVTSALVGAHAVLAVVRSFEARGAVIKSALAGQVPSGPAVNPLEEWGAPIVPSGGRSPCMWQCS